MSSHLYTTSMSSSAIDTMAASEGGAPFLSSSRPGATSTDSRLAAGTAGGYGLPAATDAGGGSVGSSSSQHQLRPLTSLRLGSLNPATGAYSSATNPTASANVGGVAVASGGFGGGGGGGGGDPALSGGVMGGSGGPAGGSGSSAALQYRQQQQQLIQRLLQQTGSGGAQSPGPRRAYQPLGPGGATNAALLYGGAGALTGGVEIREVWAHNLATEMAAVRELVADYPYVSMDTEFPGVVARPVGSFNSKTDYHFQTVRCNVDLLKIIQIGLTFCDKDGNLPPGCACWQFNFQFSLIEDMYSQDSIELLQKSGIDFQRFDRDGIDPADFGELVMASGLVLDSRVKWISFHSGYDFGYFLKLLTCVPLPAEEDGFFELLRVYFPCVYDIKYMMHACRPLHGGLQDLADDLDVKRYGPQHQAGSDSLLTAGTFFRLVEVFFEGQLDERKFNGFLSGLSPASAAASSSIKKINLT